MNLGFVAASDDDEDGCSVGKMLEEIQRKIEDAESRLAAWGDVRAAAERDAADARLVGIIWNFEDFSRLAFTLTQLA